MTVAEYISYFLKKNSIKNIFMLTGYGAMYLNDAIKKSGIKYYATRNEATAPIMAEAYARIKGGLGVACVTAGPGATNAIPGLAEAFVDSAPILVISGQVDLKQTTYNTRLKEIRTFGTAEINIIPIIKPLTKYAEIIKNPNDIKYILEKAFFIAQDKRPGPVWIDIPLNIQKAKINLKKLRGYKKIKYKKINFTKKIERIFSFLKTKKRPIIICGGGVKSSKTYKYVKKFSKEKNIPIFFSRASQDLDRHDQDLIMGLAGIKGSRYCKKIMTESDLVLGFGCRFSPQLVGHEFEVFKNAKVISVDVSKDELNKKGINIDLRINEDLKYFLPSLVSFLGKYKKIKKFNNWLNYCNKLKRVLDINNIIKKKNPIDLYYFMDVLGNFSKSKHILITEKCY